MAQTQMQWNAADYASHSTAQYAWARSLIDGLALTGSENILDLGCGDGKITAEIAQVVSGQVIGVDSSAQMIALARQQHSATLANLDFRQMDACCLEFEDEFELIFSNAVLHWIRDHRAVLAGIMRALKQGGRAVLSMGGKGNAPELLPIVDALIRQDLWRDYFTDFVFPYAFYGTEEYQQWLAEVGLQVERLELVARDMVHESVAGLKGWIRTTWLPYTQRLPEQYREQFINELTSEYIREYPVDAAGRTHVKMIRLEVEARKSK